MKDQGSTPPKTTSSIAIFTHEKYLDEPKDTELKKKKKLVINFKKEYKKLKEDTQTILMNLKRINFKNGDSFFLFLSYPCTNNDIETELITTSCN